MTRLKGQTLHFLNILVSVSMLVLVCENDPSPLSSRADCIDDLHDAMKGRVCSDSHVCSTEIIIDGTHKTHNVQMSVLLSHGVCDSPLKTHTHTHTQLTYERQSSSIVLKIIKSVITLLMAHNNDPLN